MVERYVAGRELTCGVMGDKALGVTEIIPQGHAFYDYDSKYVKGGSQHVIPAQVSPNIYQKIQTLALKAHQAIGCRGVSRSDFRFDDRTSGEGELIWLEINTQPGMTPTSLVPEMAAACWPWFWRVSDLDGGGRFVLAVRGKRGKRVRDPLGAAAAEADGARVLPRPLRKRRSLPGQPRQRPRPLSSPYRHDRCRRVFRRHRLLRHVARRPHAERRAGIDDGGRLCHRGRRASPATSRPPRSISCSSSALTARRRWWRSTSSKRAS